MAGFKKMGIFGVKNLLINQIRIHYQLEKVTMIFAQQLMKGLILILDNFRFMHGRLPYNLELKRKLYILQFRNFNY